MRIVLILAQRLGSTGSAVFSVNLMRGLLDLGHRVSLICCGRDPKFDVDDRAEILDVSNLFRNLGFDIPGMSDVMPYPSSRYSDLSSPQLNKYDAAWREVFQGVRTQSYDVIHVNHWWIAAAIARETLKCEIKVTVHGTDIEQFDRCPAIVNRYQLRDTQGVALHVVSDGLVKRLHQNEVATSVVINAPPPIREDLFRPAGEHHRRSGSLFVGKLSSAKGLEELLMSFSTVSREFPQHDLSLAGSSSIDLSFWKAAVEGLGLSARVNFLGFLQQGELAEQYRRAEVLAFPSWREGFGLVAAEAAACGAKVVMPCLDAVDVVLASELAANQLFLFDALVDETPRERKLYSERLAESWAEALRAQTTQSSFDLTTSLARKAIASRLVKELYEGRV
jgi:glycosyltransferase involved in cell wall biosynthesis